MGGHRHRQRHQWERDPRHLTVQRRGPNKAAYRVLWQVASPVNISGATIPQGARSTGKIHFDVTGPAPNTVTMNNGMEDLMIWGP